MNIYLDGIIYSLQEKGGVTRYTNELAKKFADIGHEVTFLMHPSTLGQPPKHKNIKYIHITSPLNTKNRVTKYFSYILDIIFTELHFKKYPLKNGIFHSSYFSQYKNLRIPQVITVHDMINEKFPKYFNPIQNKIFLYKKKKSILLADAIICVSQQTADDLHEIYKIDIDKINVIHLGVDEIFAPKMEKEKEDFRFSKNLLKPYFLFVGNRSKYKNFQKLIEAFADWKNNTDFSMVLVGGGKLTSDELDSIKRLGLEESVINFTFVSEEELVLFYNCAKAFIFPSLYEGFGMPIIEALACGTQVLASDIPVFREIASDNINFFDPRDNESIKSALDKTLGENMPKIEAGRGQAKEFRWDKVASSTMEVYKKIT